MNSRSTKLLVLIAVAMAAFILFFERRSVTETPVGGTTPKLFPNLQPAAVTRLELSRSNIVLRAERTNDAWTLTAPLAYPAQNLRLDSLLEVCAKLRPQTSLAARQVQSLADFGLQPPRATLTLQAGASRFELRIGAPTPVGEQLYVQVAGSESIAVVDLKLMDLLPNSATEWRDLSLLHFNAANFDRVRVRFGQLDLVVQRETNLLWRITAPQPPKRADTPQINQLLQQMEHWPVKQFVSDDPKVELEPLGLQPPEAELALGNGTNDLLVVQFGRSPTNDPALVFARRLSHTNVVLVPRAWLERFRVPLWDLSEHRLVDPLTLSAFDTIEVRGTETVQLRRQTNGLWQITAPTNELADAALVNDLLAGLADLEALKLVQEVNTDFVPYGLEPPRRRFSLLQSATNATGLSTNLLVAQVDFGANRINENDLTFFARRHDERSVYAVPRGNAELLPGALFQLRNRQLWNFSTNQVLAFSLRQGGQTRRFARNAQRLWATPGEPTDEVRSAVVDEALVRLGQLRAEAWSAKGAEKLAAFGFDADTPRLTIELAGGEKPVLLTLDFGRKTGRNPYAAIADPLDGKPVIFEFPQKLHREFITRYLMPAAQ